MTGTAELQAFVTETATRLGVPGVAVGVVLAGEEMYAFHGVTSVENPLPVDADTLFQFGSTGKTFTATAIMMLVEQGKVDLDAPVRRYVPELQLQDEETAAAVTVRHLLNHTAGWDGDLMENTGDGDDALARIVARMATIQQLTPLGATVSYNNASFYLAGRVIEKVTGLTFERAIADMIFTPLGFTHSFFFPGDIMSRRFSMGHHISPNGDVTPARPWPMPRGSAPAGGISANAAEQVAWARFHLGDGTAPDGTRLLSRESLDLMKQPTVDMRGSALGDYVGLSWLLKDVEGVRLVAHGGTTNGQHSEFFLVPGRDFGLISLTNCGPNGPQFNEALRTWALRELLGIVEPEPQVREFQGADFAPYAGRYETIAAVCEVEVRDGGLWCSISIKPEVLAQLHEGGEVPPDEPPIRLALLEGEGDRYVVAEGSGAGMKGYFARAEDGAVTGLHLGGRLANRVT